MRCGSRIFPGGLSYSSASSLEPAFRTRRPPWPTDSGHPPTKPTNGELGARPQPNVGRMAREVQELARASWPSVLKPAFSPGLRACFAARRPGRPRHAQPWSAERSPAPSCRDCRPYFLQPRLRFRLAPSKLSWHHCTASEVRDLLRRVGNRYVPRLGDHFRPCDCPNLPCSLQGRR
jgi:hypothetical protein